MEVIIRPDTAQAVELVARLLADTVRAKPDCRLGLATGATMEAVYEVLVKMYQKGAVDFSRVISFNLDEYIGLNPDDPNSYRYYMDYHLFNRINIDKHNTHLPNGLATDEVAEAEAYETAIKHAGGIDVQLLGIGRDGHIGFNEPLSSLSSRTRAKLLTPATYAQNSIYFNPPESMPRRAFTMGIQTILDAKRVIMLITGANKAEIAAKAIEGPITSMVTASALQLHPHAVVVLDAAAASLLTQKEYYELTFANEPEWENYR